MLPEFNPFSLIRRPFARLGEFAFYGQVGEGLGITPRFNETMFGEHLAFNLVVFVAASILYDLVELVTRPDVASPCVGSQRELPFEEEK